MQCLPSKCDLFYFNIYDTIVRKIFIITPFHLQNFFSFVSVIFVVRFEMDFLAMQQSESGALLGEDLLEYLAAPGGLVVRKDAPLAPLSYSSSSARRPPVTAAPTLLLV